MPQSGRAGPPPAQLAYVRFPPRWRTVLVPTRPARATTMAMSLYTAVKPLPVALQQGLWLAARVGGARVLPGARETWSPPLEADAWHELWRSWADAAAAPIEGIAVYERLQAERAGLTLLLCAGRASLLVRVRRDPASLARERAVSEAPGTRGTASFRVPALAAAGESAGWHWVAYEAISSRPHLPAFRLPPGAFDEISDVVESTVPRPAGVPAHWRGAHGDVVPWNLRRAAGRRWLLDWEDADWAPPGTDQLYLRAAGHAMRPGPVRPLRVAADHDEARERLVGVVRERPAAASEQRLRGRLLRLLGDDRDV